MPKYCRTEREDKLLVVTLDRPEVLNSLNAPACFELDEVFNDFEGDPTLWIAVITGAGGGGSPPLGRRNPEMRTTRRAIHPPTRHRGAGGRGIRSVDRAPQSRRCR